MNQKQLQFDEFGLDLEYFNFVNKRNPINYKEFMEFCSTLDKREEKLENTYSKKELATELLIYESCGKSGNIRGLDFIKTQNEYNGCNKNEI